MRAGIEPAGQTLRKEVIATLRKEVIAFARRLSRPLRSPSRDAPQASKPHRQDCLACLLLENPPVGLWHACSDRQNDAGVESSGGSSPAGEKKKPHRVDDRGSSARGDQSIYTWSTARAARGACSQGTDRQEASTPQRTQCRAVPRKGLGIFAVCSLVSLEKGIKKT